MLLASLRLHAAAGARVALRNSVLGTMTAVFVMGSAPQPPGLIGPLSSGVAGAESSTWALAIVAFFAAALSRQALPQLSSGHGGWMRSLPTNGATRRRALVGACIMAQAPVLVFLAVALAIVLATPAWHVAPGKLAAWPPIVVGAAMLVVPTRRRLMVAVATVLAIAAAMTSSWWGLAVSLLLLFLADRMAGGDAQVVRPRRIRVHLGAALLPYRIAVRAISWRAIGPLVSGSLPVGFAWLMSLNNAMVGTEAATVIGTGGIVGVALALAGVASALQLRRPAWAWARSLPSSSTQRVVSDAIILLAAVVPLWVMVAVANAVAGFVVVAVSPLMSFVAAGSMRRAGKRITGTHGEVFAVGVLIAVAVGQSGWLALACVALTPAALRVAEHRERIAQATAWAERHHSAVGDALAWSGS